MESSSSPVKINEGFKCQKCGKQNPKAEKTCRNHCKYCLWSVHVDKKIPGDRESTCLGLMEPISAYYHTKKGQQLIHECTRCHTKSTNKVADDDDLDILAKIIERTNINQNYE